MTELALLKLGGSLITDKTRPYNARIEKIADLAREIAAARRTRPDLPLLLGHGSGSFGHTAAKQYGTKEGLPARSEAGAEAYWRGFTEVWFQASALNRLVMESLHSAGLPAVALAPVASVMTRGGELSHWDLAPIRAALAAGLLPVIYGDVAFDEARGGTILSTEDLFSHLAAHLHPERILLAGNEPGVWADYPTRHIPVHRITPTSLAAIQGGLGASHGADVTGGMAAKVRQMLGLVELLPGLRVQIFSGEEPGNTQRVLEGAVLGTEILPDQPDSHPGM